MARLQDKLVERYISSAIQTAAKFGLTISVETDFDEFHATCPILEGKAKPIGIFNHTQPDFDAIWIKGVDEYRRVVHTQAYRNLDFGGITMGQHLFENRLDYMSHGYGIDPDKSIFHKSSAAGLQAGRTTYCGEIWLDKSKRGSALALVLSRLALAVCYQRWGADYIWGFMYNRLIYKGIGAQYGYPHAATGGISWWRPGESEYLNEWLVWVSKTELEIMFNYPIDGEHECLVPTSLDIRAA